MDSITGMLGHIKFHKISDFSDAGNKYIIACFDLEDTEGGLYRHDFDQLRPRTIIKGEMNNPVDGWQYTLYGHWKEDARGKHFAFFSFEPHINKSNDGMADYLSRSVPEIGKVYARAIVDHFGNDSFKILKSDPSKISEVSKIKSFAQRAVRDWFENDNAGQTDPAAYARLFDLLSPVRPPRKVITSLLKNFRSNAPQFISEHPYKLLDYPGMGWIRVDKFAVKILGYDKNGTERHKHAFCEVIDRNAESGHTKAKLDSLICDTSDLLKVAFTRECVGHLENEGSIISKDGYISSRDIYDDENEIATQIKRLARYKPNFNIDLNDTELDDKQTLIPKMILDNCVSIISGVPGSGKSHSIARIVRKFYEGGINSILVCCPTGKAAKRNSEFLQTALPGVDIPCATIHRALGAVPSPDEPIGIPESEARINRGRERFKFRFDDVNQLPYQVYITDESSMIDVSLMASFLKAIPDGSTLIIVGDKYQLPSVGPGSVLRDLLKAGVPSVILDKPRRNSGAIAHACYQIKEGINPDPEILRQDFGQDKHAWTHLEISKDEKILDCIVQIHKNYIERNSLTDIKLNVQVISPEKKGVLGCNNLNRVLGEIINPGKILLSNPKDENSDPVLRIGDKVVRTRNSEEDWLVSDLDPEYTGDADIDSYDFDGDQYEIHKCLLVNGDGGEIIGIKENHIIVEFSNPKRLCRLKKGSEFLLLAYSLTIHKVQGSQYPIVIMPLTNYYWNDRTNSGLWCRETLYTGWSRPSERLITVGKISEAYQAISRRTINQRQTHLVEMLSNEIT